MNRDSWQSRAVRYHQELKKPRLKFFYRCALCRRRKVLKKELWEYLRPPVCCRKTEWIIDNHRYHEWKNKVGAYSLCSCASGTFWDAPHKPCSIVWCEKSKASAEDIENAQNQYRK